MDPHMHYETVDEALTDLKSKGFMIDYNLPENIAAFKTGKLNANDFEIVDTYRYEGNTDPEDESAVYALKSNSGEKGFLVVGYGFSADADTSELVQQIRKRV
jgi:hypothetical protein